MYQSPIHELTDKMIAEVNMNYENAVMKAVYQVGFYVDKEELLKALKYDRDQYDKGYEDGVRECTKLIVERLQERLDEPMYQHYGEDYFVGVISAMGIVEEVGG